MKIYCFLLAIVAMFASVSAWQTTKAYSIRHSTKTFMVQKEDPSTKTTEKYGLEVGLLESIQKDDGGDSAKSLLKKYGIAYLATSIPLALMSFGLCYVLVDSGIDVSALLGNVGIDNVSSAGETAGTFAIAYAAHKAASPIRFPPTVLLTPIVAKWIGSSVDSAEEEQKEKGV